MLVGVKANTATLPCIEYDLSDEEALLWLNHLLI